jgi:hypothetical protein
MDLLYRTYQELAVVQRDRGSSKGPRKRRRVTVDEHGALIDELSSRLESQLRAMPDPLWTLVRQAGASAAGVEGTDSGV